MLFWKGHPSSTCRKWCAPLAPTCIMLLCPKKAVALHFEGTLLVSVSKNTFWVDSTNTINNYYASIGLARVKNFLAIME